MRNSVDKEQKVQLAQEFLGNAAKTCGRMSFSTCRYLLTTKKGRLISLGLIAAALINKYGCSKHPSVDRIPNHLSSFFKSGQNLV